MDRNKYIVLTIILLLIVCFASYFILMIKAFNSDPLQMQRFIKKIFVASMLKGQLHI